MKIIINIKVDEFRISEIQDKIYTSGNLITVWWEDSQKYRYLNRIKIRFMMIKKNNKYKIKLDYKDNPAITFINIPLESVGIYMS